MKKEQKQQIPEYSLVILPAPPQMMSVLSYKHMLKSEIGWFNSINSAAHVTVINFLDEPTLNQYIGKIREFCKTQQAKEVLFDHYNSFGNHTFFIEPSADSQLYLNKLIIDVHEYLGIRPDNVHAHLSIATGLDAEKMEIAKELFQTVDVHLEFSCDAFHLRKFNPETRQYSDIIEKIAFGK